MSSAPQPGQPDAETQQQQQKGAETFLSPDERKQLQRMMGFPSDYPKEMMSYIKGWLEVNPPDIPIGSIKGGKGVPRYVDRATSTSMTAVGSTATETTVYSLNLKAKTVAPTGQIRILFFYTARCSDGSNTLRIRIKLGGTEIMFYEIGTDTLDGNDRLGVADIKIVNAGAYTSQLAYVLAIQNSESGAYTDIKTLGSSTKDTSADQTLSITADWVSAGTQNFAPTYLSVEVFNPVGS